MKVVFISIVTAFTICLSRGLPRHRHKKFPQRRETRQQEAYIGPKPGTKHNRLFPEYGTNFRYVGEVKHGLDGVTVVTSIPIPKYSDIKKKPLDFNCTIDLSRKEARTQGSYQYRAHEYCAKVQPYIKYMQTQQKSLVHSLRQLLIHELYAALPELHPYYEVQNDKSDESPSSLPEDEKELNRERRGIGAIFSSVLPGLITLAVESLTSWIKGKQQNRIHQAVDKMRKTESDVKNTLTQYQEDFLMYGKYSVESLNKVIDTLNSLHDKHTELEKLVTTKMFTEVESMGDALDYSVELQLFLAMAQEEHVTKYKEVFKAGKELLDAIAILSQRRLPRSLFPDQRIEGILAQVDKMVRLRYPDYELAANHISHYRDMELVTFSVDRITHSLVVTFPVFIKDYKQPPLLLFEIETVPVPIPDRNKQADSYSQLRIQKDYIAAGMDYYIQIRMTEMLMCKSIGYINYSEELFVVKHKSKHSCASAIFYELGPSQVIKNCKFDYLYNETVSPVILDCGKDILLANFQGPRSLKCTSVNGGLAKPAPEHTYAVVDREFLCDCQLDLEHAIVLRQLSSCNRESSKLVMQFHVNIAFYELLRERSPQTAELVQPKFTDHRQIFEIKLSEGKPRRIDQPTDLETFMEKIDKNCKKIPSKSMIESKAQTKPILPRWINNILVIISTVVSTILALLVLVLLTKHFKIKSLLATLVLSTLPPPPEATAYKYDLGQTDLSQNSVLKLFHAQFPKTGIETYTHIPDKLCENCKIFQRTKGPAESVSRPNALISVESKAPAEPRKVVCSYPITTMWSNVLGSMVICYAIVRYIKPMTWYRGYKYSRNCTFYLFIFTDHYHSPLKICPLRGHLQNYKIEDSGADLELTLHKNWIYDTVNISWGDIQVLENEIPIKLPRTVSIPLRHKIKNRRMMSFEWDVQYMVKQEPNWYNLTRTYKAKRKAVSFANLHETDEGENSSLCERVIVRKEPIVKEVLI